MENEKQRDKVKQNHLTKIRCKMLREGKRVRQECSKSDYIARMSKSKFKRDVYRAIFDSDSFKITLDSGFLCCISHSTRDFIGTITPTTKFFDKIARCLNVTGMGTVEWALKDNKGICHKIQIPNLL